MSRRARSATAGLYVAAASLLSAVLALLTSILRLAANLVSLAVRLLSLVAARVESAAVPRGAARPEDAGAPRDRRPRLELVGAPAKPAQPDAEAPAAAPPGQAERLVSALVGAGFGRADVRRYVASLGASAETGDMRALITGGLRALTASRAS